MTWESSMIAEELGLLNAKPVQRIERACSQVSSQYSSHFCAQFKYCAAWGWLESTEGSR